jgi:putative NADH-flavin reductase
MARISVLGGTGYAGAAVVREAAKRGHQVTALSRTAPDAPVAGVTYVTGSVLDQDVLKGAVEGADVVFEALSPRGDMVGKVQAVIDDLIRVADNAGVRLGVLGGVSSVLVAPDGPRLFDVSQLPPEVLPEVQLGLDKLDAMKAAPESLDWFYVSPAMEFGAWVPSTETGEYRISDDVLLKGPDDKSEISAVDLAIAVLDEIEQPAHRRRRFHVAH